MTVETNRAPNPRRLYRDTENGILAGVCAGIADFFGFSVKATRWVVALGCLFAMPALRAVRPTSLAG